MAVDFGAAIAQGMMTGMGQQTQQYFTDMRRERLDEKKVENAFNAFKKQSVFASRMKAVEAQNVTADTWRMNAAKTVDEIVREGAFEAAKGLAPTDKPMFIQDYMKRSSGITKAEALAQRGIVMADYSQFTDDPTLMEAIPQSNLIGADGPDASMQEVYKHNPAEFQNVVQEQAAKLTDYDKKQRDDIAALNSVSALQFGASLSKEASNAIWRQLGNVQIQVTEGGKVSNPAMTMLSNWIQQGKVQEVNGQYHLKSEFEIPQQEIQPTPVQPMQADVYEDPTLAAEHKEKLEKERKKLVNTKVEALGKQMGTSIEAMNSLESLGKTLTGLSQDAKDILFGAPSLKGLLSLTDVGTRIAAKQDVAGAKEAMDFLAKMTNVSASLAHEQYGSAQTPLELKNFAKQLGDPSILQNPDTLLDQIVTRMNLVGSAIESGMSGYDAEVRQAYMDRNPQFTPSVIQALGMTEKAKPTVSDLTEEEPKVATEEELKKEAPKPSFTQGGKPVELPQDLLTRYINATPEQQKVFREANNLTIF